MPPSLLVLGLRYEPPSANVSFWRMERFIFPLALQSDMSIRNEIKSLLIEADDAQKSLWLYGKSFARHALSHGDREPAGQDISAFIDQMSVYPKYWAFLEVAFHEILEKYGTDTTSDEVRSHWLKKIRDALTQAWQHHRTSVAMDDAWAVRALVKSEIYITRKLKELNEEILKLVAEVEAP
jgi:CRISPR system Cascade subunit CasA